jgi:hypothetical protein
MWDNSDLKVASGTGLQRWSTHTGIDITQQKGFYLDCCTAAPSHEKKEEFKFCHSVKQNLEDQNHGIVGDH